MAAVGARQSGLTLNLAIGPSCFVRCKGCYHHFAGTGRTENTVSAAELLDFVDAALALGLEQVTVSGGDPLSHPEIVKLLRGLAVRPVYKKLDTVGTALLDDARTIFYGQRMVPRIPITEIARLVDHIGIPLDGATAEVQTQFRSGRDSLVLESQELVRRLRSAGAHVGVNTVVHRGNLDQIPQIARLLRDVRPHTWQLFQFQPSGPLGSRVQSLFMISRAEFDEALRVARELTELLIDTQGKSADERAGIYLLVDDAGIAFIPHAVGATRDVIGHITLDRDAVLQALRSHFSDEPLAS